MECNRLHKSPQVKECKTCGENIRKGIFCSRSCAAKTNNAGVRRHGSNVNSFGVLKGKCGHCNMPVSQYFCNNTCFSKFTSNLKAFAYLAGDTKIASAQNGEIKLWLVEWLKELVDFTCQECGWREFHPVDGRPGVQVDHINGSNKDHRPENLRVLCPNCHWKTETYCGRNKNMRL